MTMTSNDINQKQNEPEFIGLLKAADAAYMYARRVDSVRTVITIASVGGAILASVRTDLANALSVGGAIGAVVNELVRYFLTLRWTRTAMLFQECFDTGLFGLKWNTTLGRKPREEDRRYWEKKFRGDVTRKQKWYIDVEGLPAGHAVLLCQRENLAWDARLRRIWGTSLIVLAVSWIALGVLIGGLAEWKVSELVIRWLVPSAPALMFAIGSGFRHRRIAGDKDELINRIEDLLEAVSVHSAQGEKRLLDRSREFQDQAARLREEESRVQGWLYTWFRSDYEDQAASAAKRWRDHLLRDMSKKADHE